MKTRFSQVLVLVALIFPGIGLGSPTVSPTDSPTPDFTPRPTSTPLVAPTWAPTSAGTVPEAMKPKKPSPWLSSVGLGMGIPLSNNLKSVYSTGFNAGLGTGLKVDNQLSLWLNFDLGLYNSKNNQASHNNDFSLVEAAFGVRYRALDSDVSPYVFAGPGFSYNEYRSNQGAVLDPNTGYGYIPVNAYEFDFLAEGGLGLDVRMAKGMTAYLQGKLTCDFISPAFARYGSTDSPVFLMPFELGILFGI